MSDVDLISVNLLRGFCGPRRDRDRPERQRELDVVEPSAGGVPVLRREFEEARLRPDRQEAKEVSKVASGSSPWS